MCAAVSCASQRAVSDRKDNIVNKQKGATSNKCHATRNKCLTSSNKLEVEV